MKPDFLSSLVHELRTPLTALQGSLGLLSGSLADGSEEARVFGDIALRNVARLSHLLDDVAAFVRLERPDVSVTRVSVDVPSIFERAGERVRAVAASRGVTVEMQHASCDATVDEGLLLDAVTRLLFYAVRVTPRSGQVCVSAEQADGGIAIRVTDRGRHVPDSDVARIFEPFSPAARRGVDSADRAGLDLAIAKLVAERHGGSIDYQQVPG
jgi:signal transduction histidine kinase